MVAALTAFPERTTKRAAMVAVLTAACVASNYALIGVVNVKFMDLIVFVAGFSLGPIVGASVGVLTWLVYGSLNPYGFSLPILVITSVGESLYGIVGGLLGRGSERAHRGVSDSAKFAVVGFLLTFAYDLVTNVVSGVSVGIPVHVALVTGIPFAIVHEVSNAVFFFIGASPLISAVDRVIRRE
jgi:uncharacterized membrane protein